MDYFKTGLNQLEGHIGLAYPSALPDKCTQVLEQKQSQE